MLRGDRGRAQLICRSTRAPRDVIGGVEEARHFVTRYHDRRATGRQLREHASEFLGVLRLDSSQRLVGEQAHRLAYERGCDLRPAPLAARQLEWTLVEHLENTQAL